MIVNSEKTLANGTRRVTVTLSKGEVLQALNEDRHYRLSDPMDDVVPGSVILGVGAVSWCPNSQAWVG